MFGKGALVVGLLCCVLGVSCVEFTNQFVAEVEGGDTAAQELAALHGLRLLHKSEGMEGVYHFAHDSVNRRAKRSADDLLTNLKADHRIRYVAQQEILHREKRASLPSERDIVYDKQVELDLPVVDKAVLLERYFGSANKRGEQDCSNSDLKRDLMPFNDPYYCLQWYLTNNGQTNGVPGTDLNVMKAWKRGLTGKGVTITVLDDGLYHEHPDIRDSYDPKASWDLNDPKDMEHDPNPSGGTKNAHGTRCAGEIVGKPDNGVCGVGVSYGAKIGGVRLLDGRVTDALEMEALVFELDYVDIVSASWGPRDDGKVMDGPRHFGQQALKDGADNGRNGLGRLYAWATGNGGQYDDDCSCDGYVSSPYTISFGSINAMGESAFFTEMCTPVMAVTPTGGSHAKPGDEGYTSVHVTVITTDINDGCDLNFQGTSSSAPLAAGCLALLLEANPQLTWRDVQNIIAETSVIPNQNETNWFINGAGYHVSPRFGFGTLDCYGMVLLGEKWPGLADHHICETPRITEDVDLPAGGSITRVLTTDACADNADEHVSRLEHTQLYIKMDFSRRGDLSIHLISPSGTDSQVLHARPLDDSEDGLDWMFMTVHNWGEDPSGEWTIIIKDNDVEETGQNVGVLKEWGLVFWGDEGTRTSLREDIGNGDSARDEKAHVAEPTEVKDIFLEEAYAKEMEKKEKINRDEEYEVDRGYDQNLHKKNRHEGYHQDTRGTEDIYNLFERVLTKENGYNSRNTGMYKKENYKRYYGADSISDIRKKELEPENIEDDSLDDTLDLVDEILREINHERRH